MISTAGIVSYYGIQQQKYEKQVEYSSDMHD